MKNNKKKLKNNMLGILKYAFLIVVVVIINIPIFAGIQVALKPSGSLLSGRTSDNINITFTNFSHVMRTTLYGRNLLNSLIVALSVSVIVIIIASLAGYALSRFRGSVFNAYSVMMLMAQIFPLAILIIPLFIVFRKLGLIDNIFSLIFSYMALSLPFSIWMLRAFFDTISEEIEAAARIDGCSQFGSFFHIVLPLSAPGITAVGIFSFIMSWNEFMLANVFINRKELMTLTVGLRSFSTFERIDYPLTMAAATLAMVPAFLFLIFAQKYLIQGLTAGALKE